jgi:hypothetical protein
MEPTDEEQPLSPEAPATLLFEGEKRRPDKHKGRPLSPAHRAALSRAHTGRPLSPEHRAAISQGLREKGLSPAQRAAISRALTGRPKTPEHRAAISRGRKGMKPSPEHRAAVSRALKGKRHRPHKNKGRPLSPEHRAALSSALKGKKHKPRKPGKISARWACSACGVTARPSLISRWHSRPGCVIFKVEEEIPDRHVVDKTEVTRPL